MSSLHDLYAPVAGPLADCARLLASALESDQPLFSECGAHLRGRAGKHLRAALLLLAAEATGSAASRATGQGAACELIHLASLIHDDVIDEADSRRGAPSVNGAFGNRAAILFGDKLYCHAFLCLPETGRDAALDELLAAALLMCEGQALELDTQRHGIRSLARYLDVIGRKTAALFECALRIGASVGGAPEADRDRLGRFGRALGLAFQVTDDLLDVTADAAALGKPVLSDLRAGHATAPVLFALEDRRAAETLEPLLAPEAVQDNVTRIRALLESSGGIARARAFALERAAEAEGHLAGLSRVANPAALASLSGLARSAVERER